MNFLIALALLLPLQIERSFQSTATTVKQPPSSPLPLAQNVNPTVVKRTASGMTTVVKDVPPVPPRTEVTVAVTPKLSDDAVFSWDVSPEANITIVSEEPNQLKFDAPASPEVEYLIKWTSKEPKQRQVIVRGKVKAGKGPKPPPDPIDPVDPVDPPDGKAPIPDPGFRALIVYQDSDMLSYTPGQRAAIQGSKELREYLEAKCVAGPAGWKEWRIYDADVADKMQNESPLWQTVMKRPRTKLPWLVISTGKTGFEGPMPDKLEDTMALLKKYGG